MLNEGDKAPTFSLQGDDGEAHEVSSVGKTVVVYFYPKDDTPGCTIEAKDFSADDARARLSRAGVAVFGISKDSVASHAKFCKKHGLRVRLLSDPDLAVHTLFGAYGEKTMYGRKVLGTIRSTFVLRDGKVLRAFPSVKVPGHVEAVLAVVEGGSAAPAKKAAPANAKKTATPKPAKAKTATPTPKPAKKTSAPKTATKKASTTPRRAPKP
ncbi:MAG: redoxin domain-containing protein [Myxococcales bacterium]|nr:redoxin domain-containing protein [Myxococcales bacterium]